MSSSVGKEYMKWTTNMFETTNQVIRCYKSNEITPRTKVAYHYKFIYNC